MRYKQVFFYEKKKKVFRHEQLKKATKKLKCVYQKNPGWFSIKKNIDCCLEKCIVTGMAFRWSDAPQYIWSVMCN